MQTQLGKQIWELYKTPEISDMLAESFGTPKKAPKKPTFVEPKKDTVKRNAVLISEHDVMDEEFQEVIEEPLAKPPPKKIKKDDQLKDMFRDYVMFAVMVKVDKIFARLNGKEEENVNDTNDKKTKYALYEKNYNQIVQDIGGILISAIKDMRSSDKEHYTKFVKFVEDIIPKIVNFEIQEEPISKTHICYFSQIQYKGNQGNNGNTTVRIILEYSKENREVMEDMRVVGERLESIEMFISRTWAPLVTAFVVLQHAGTRLYREVSTKLGLDKIQTDKINFDIISRLIKFVSEDTKKQDGIIYSEISNIKAAMTKIFDEMSPKAKRDLTIKEKDLFERWLK